MKNPIYTYRGISYEIIREETDKWEDEGRADQLLRDFQHCERIGDWTTITNRMNNGLMWGWLKEIETKEEEKKEFW